ncbi:expressed unknown protein [Seminavis robusta]|uniref:Uncharacterized protein n=1 Tax=Seminavis robusta TaxID=568900 RepID=A0A9N8DHT8_9STRA|nr:expressed unknown protein [Seminavis robusta]|eukprot:Sro72_g039970.1 n/a (262) ;mRNA; f:86881-87666
MWKSRHQLLLSLLFLLHVSSNGFLSHAPSGRSSLALSMITSSSSDDTQKLLERAAQLREEANTMETQLRAERGTSRPVVMDTIPEPRAPTIKYDKLPNSKWEIKYRFAEEPVKDRDEDAGPLEYYRGKLVLHLRDDGYTDILSEEGGDDDDNRIRVTKIWGWDEELVQEDNTRYLLFSMDAKTPNSSKLRFYFQAKLEQESRTSIALKGGTVTIKQDLAEEQKMMAFGFFSAKGILARFRYVGEFAASPYGGAVDNSEESY